MYYTVTVTKALHSCEADRTPRLRVKFAITTATGFTNGMYTCVFWQTCIVQSC
jgi:hypothetical protein